MRTILAVAAAAAIDPDSLEARRAVFFAQHLHHYPSVVYRDQYRGSNVIHLGQRESTETTHYNDYAVHNSDDTFHHNNDVTFHYNNDATFHNINDATFHNSHDDATFHNSHDDVIHINDDAIHNHNDDATFHNDDDAIHNDDNTKLVGRDEENVSTTESYFHELFPDADEIILTLADEFSWTSGAIGAAAAGSLMGVFACGLWSYNRFSTRGFADQTESISVYDSESILGADLDEFLN